MTATTGLTAQNTQGVVGIHQTPPEFVKKQIDACAEDVGVDVVKTGIEHSYSSMKAHSCSNSSTCLHCLYADLDEAC